MTTDELLKPRYKVIANYPFSPYQIGDIMKTSKHGSFHMTTTNYRDEFGEYQECDNYHSEKELINFPVLFKKLEWWEERKPEEMPKYVKPSRATDYIFKVEKFIQSITEFIGRDGNIHTAHTKVFLPATEEEYNNQ